MSLMSNEANALMSMIRTFKETISNSDAGFNLELQQYLGIYDFNAQSLENLSLTHQHDITELVDQFKAIRDSLTRGQDLGSIDTPTFFRELPDEDLNQLKIDLETDCDGLVSTVDFLLGRKPANPGVTSKRSRRNAKVFPATLNRPNQSPERTGVLTEEFSSWNHALAEELLERGGVAYLGFVVESLGRLAPSGALDEDKARNSLVAAVRANLGEGSALLTPFLGAVRAWERTPGENPYPAIPLLAVFCLAAGDMKTIDERAANNYYIPLGELLGLSSLDQRLLGDWYRDADDEFWESYKQWLSKKEIISSARSVGRNRHVGIPISQVLFRAIDRERINEFLERSTPVDIRTVVDPEPLFEKFFNWLPGAELSVPCRTLLDRLPPKHKQDAARAVFDSQFELLGSETRQHNRPKSSRGRVLLNLMRLHPVNPKCELSLSVDSPEQIPADGCFLETVDLEREVARHKARVEYPSFGPKVGLKSISFPEHDVPNPELLMTAWIRLMMPDDRVIERPNHDLMLFQEQTGGQLLEVRRASQEKQVSLLYDSREHPDVDRFLKDCEGIDRSQMHDSQSIQAIPDGWKLVYNVRLDFDSESLPHDLESFSPSISSSIRFLSAPRLTRYRNHWLSTVLPLVTVESSGQSVLVVTSTTDTNGQRPVRRVFYDHAEIPLVELVSGQGQYRAAILGPDDSRRTSVSFEISPPVEQARVVQGSQPLDSLNRMRLAKDQSTNDGIHVLPDPSMIHSIVKPPPPVGIDLSKDVPAITSLPFDGFYRHKARTEKHLFFKNDDNQDQCFVCRQTVPAGQVVPTEFNFPGHDMYLIRNSGMELLAGVPEQTLGILRSHLAQVGYPFWQISLFLRNCATAGMVNLEYCLHSWSEENLSILAPSIVRSGNGSWILAGSLQPSVLRSIQERVSGMGIKVDLSANSLFPPDWPTILSVIDDGAAREGLSDAVQQITAIQPSVISCPTEEALADETSASEYIELLDWHQADDTSNRGEETIGMGSWSDYRLRLLPGGNYLVNDAHRQAFIGRHQYQVFHQLFSGEVVIRHYLNNECLVLLKNFMLPGIIERALFIESGNPPVFDGGYRYYTNIKRRTAERLEQLLKG